MIKVKVNYEDDYIKYFKITGHSGYDVKGKDIVCSSVSSIVISSINLCLSFDKDSINYIDKDGLIEVHVNKTDDVINKVLINMIDMLKELESNYRENIKFI